MENSLNLYKSWIFNSAKNSNIKISELSWPAKFGLALKDYIVQVKVEGRDFIGHGTDVDSDLAILKAMSEAYERYCVTLLELKNSNGCAAHVNFENAKEAALLELIERDCFLVNFIKRARFNEVDSCLNKVNLESQFRLTNYEIASGKYKVFLARIEIDKASNIFGLGTSFKVEEAIEKSQTEALRQLQYVLDKNLISRINYEKIDRKEKLTFDDHGDIALTSRHYGEIEGIFDQRNVQNKSFEYFPIENTVFTNYEIKLERINPFFGIPLFFIKATNLEAQELFSGRTIENINPRRIANDGNLNLCLHPFR